MIDSLRHRMKRMQRDGRMPWLTSLASYGWYQSKNAKDWLRMPEVRRALDGGDVPEDVEGLVAFVMDRFDGIVRPLQDRAEITALVAELMERRPQTVLEVGTARGGTLFLLCRAAHPEATIISLDLPYARNGGGFPEWKQDVYRRFARPGQTLHLVRGNSHELGSRDRVVGLLGGRPLDFILIDADHSYDGVKRDFELYYPLLAPDGLLAMHDVMHNPHDPTIDVHRFWTELQATLETRELATSRRRFGIGLVPAGQRFEAAVDTAPV
ncbi:MAG: class I SAM-dependent methyltransferase [Thermaurantiacus sp.]